MKTVKRINNMKSLLVGMIAVLMSGIFSLSLNAFEVSDYELEDLLIEKEEYELEEVRYMADHLLYAYTIEGRYQNDLAFQVAPLVAEAELAYTIAKKSEKPEEEFLENQTLLLDIAFLKEELAYAEIDMNYLLEEIRYESEMATLSHDMSKVEALEEEKFDKELNQMILQFELAEATHNIDVLDETTEITWMEVDFDKEQLIDSVLEHNAELALLEKKLEAAEMTFSIATQHYKITDLQTFRDSINVIMARNNYELAEEKLRGEMDDLFTDYYINGIRYQLGLLEIETLLLEKERASQLFDLDLIAYPEYIKAQQNYDLAVFELRELEYKNNQMNLMLTNIPEDFFPSAS